MKNLEALSKLTDIPVEDFTKALNCPKPCLAATVREATMAYNSASCGESQYVAFQRWNELSLREVEAATTSEGAWRVYCDSPENSEAERAAIAKWASLCAAIDEVLKFYGDTGHYLAIHTALRRIYELFPG